jgi:hypothetical protein
MFARLLLFVPGRVRVEPLCDGEPDDGSRYYQHWLAALEQDNPPMNVPPAVSE